MSAEFALLKSIPGSLTRILLYLISQRCVMWALLTIRKAEICSVTRYFDGRKKRIWIGLLQTLCCIQGEVSSFSSLDYPLSSL